MFLAHLVLDEPDDLGGEGGGAAQPIDGPAPEDVEIVSLAVLAELAVGGDVSLYVLPEAELDQEPPQRAVPKAESMEHARLDRQFTAILQRRDPTELAPESVVGPNGRRRSEPLRQHPDAGTVVSLNAGMMPSCVTEVRATSLFL